MRGFLRMAALVAAFAAQAGCTLAVLPGFPIPSGSVGVLPSPNAPTPTPKETPYPLKKIGIGVIVRSACKNGITYDLTLVSMDPAYPFAVSASSVSDKDARVMASFGAYAGLKYELRMKAYGCTQEIYQIDPTPLVDDTYLVTLPPTFPSPGPSPSGMPKPF